MQPAAVLLLPRRPPACLPACLPTLLQMPTLWRPSRFVSLRMSVKPVRTKRDHNKLDPVCLSFGKEKAAVEAVLSVSYDDLPPFLFP